MEPTEKAVHTTVGHRGVAGAVLGQDSLTCSESARVTRGTGEDATATPAPARRPTVISSVPGTEYQATSPVSLRSRLDSSPREVDAPRRKRGR